MNLLLLMVLALPPDQKGKTPPPNDSLFGAKGITEILASPLSYGALKPALVMGEMGHAKTGDPPISEAKDNIVPVAFYKDAQPVKKQEPPAQPSKLGPVKQEPKKVEPPPLPPIPDLKPDILKMKEFLEKQIAPVQPSPKPEEKKPQQRMVMENRVVQLAAMDLRTINPFDQPYIRYIWVRGADLEEMQVTSLALNYISRGPVLVRPLPLGEKELMVLRINLRSYAPRDEDLADMCKVWDEFQYEPKFNLLITKDTLKFASGEVQDKKVKSMKTVPIKGAKKDEPTFQQKEVEGPLSAASFDDVDLIRVNSEFLDSQSVAYLQETTRCPSPVISHEYFIVRALTAIEDKGVYKQLYGGMYYKLAGIKKGFKKGTDEDNFLEGLGIGNVDKGITADKLFKELRSDQRAAIFRSGITGRPRRIDVFRTLLGRIDGGQSIVSFTHDIKAQDIDIGTHPIMNLLDFKDAAREVIFEKSNGLHGFVLFDGNGALQNEVPPDIAGDHMIPVPHGSRLEPAIGCIRCHASDGGWRVANNDAKKLLSGYVDVFGDATTNTASDAVNRIAGLYAGDLEFRTFPRARDDYASNILRCTGPWKASKNQTDIVKFTSGKLADIVKRYKYDLVHASNVLDDLGVSYDPDDEDAADILKSMIPLPRVRIDNLIPEDPRIAALFMGLGINRSDYDLVYSFIVTRSLRQ